MAAPYKQILSIVCYLCVWKQANSIMPLANVCSYFLGIGNCKHIISNTTIHSLITGLFIYFVDVTGGDCLFSRLWQRVAGVQADNLHFQCSTTREGWLSFFSVRCNGSGYIICWELFVMAASQLTRFFLCNSLDFEIKCHET